MNWAGLRLKENSFVQQISGLPNILTEQSGICRGIELYILDITPLIVQVLLYDSDVLRVFGHFKLADISIQPLTRNLAAKSFLCVNFDAVSALW